MEKIIFWQICKAICISVPEITWMGLKILPNHDVQSTCKHIGLYLRKKAPFWMHSRTPTCPHSMNKLDTCYCVICAQKGDYSNISAILFFMIPAVVRRSIQLNLYCRHASLQRPLSQHLSSTWSVTTGGKGRLHLDNWSVRISGVQHGRLCSSWNQ
jgi:hypothetical protein